MFGVLEVRRRNSYKLCQCLHYKHESHKAVQAQTAYPQLQEKLMRDRTFHLPGVFLGLSTQHAKVQQVQKAHTRIAEAGTRSPNLITIMS